MLLLQEFGRRQAQHRIAEKFEPLMVVGQPGRAVAEGLLDRGQGRGAISRAAGGGGIQPQAAQEAKQLVAALRGHGGGGSGMDSALIIALGSAPVAALSLPLPLKSPRPPAQCAKYPTFTWMQSSQPPHKLQRLVRRLAALGRSRQRPMQANLSWKGGSDSSRVDNLQRELGSWSVRDAGSREHGGGALQQLEQRQERQAHKRAAKPLLLRDLLGRGGWGLLALFAVRLLTSVVPFQFNLPEWYGRLGGELINTSPVLLTGFVLLLCAGLLNTSQPVDRLPRFRVVLWLVQLALWLYLLVIPTQLVVTVMVVQRAEARLAIQWTWVQEQMASAKKRQAAPEDLKQLGQLEDKLKLQRSKGQRQMNYNLWRELLRVWLSAAVLVAALWLPLRALDGQESDSII